MLSPEEENEQILQGMREGGDDLSTVRPVYFQFVFPSGDKAEEFAKAVAERDLLITVYDEGDGPAEGFPFDVEVTVEMQPELNSISGYERDLGELAAAHRGRSDGWFCERIVPAES